MASPHFFLKSYSKVPMFRIGLKSNPKMRFAMNYQTYSKETNIPYQTFFYQDVEIKNIEDPETTVTDDSSTVVFEEKLRAAKGIIYASIFCIPFWFFFIKFVIWLVQK
jgi:hypothetical protein